MKGLLIFFAMALTLCHLHSGMAQRMMSLKPKKPVVCYHSFENRPDHVGVSEKFKQLRHRATGRAKASTIEVEYINFPADGLAKHAFQYAVAIWETELTSSVPIRIHADWRKLDTGVLGQAVWGTAHANFGGEQHVNVFYPVALAEKITGKELNPATEPDIVASFNSSASWYFGTDGKTPAGKMDMVTIVLHEIAHGLGFTDTYDVMGSQGSVGLFSDGESVPFIFDVFVEDDLQKNLLHDFQSPSTQLRDALQSSDLFFNGPMAISALAGQKPELYAPESFDNGSSISHLDEGTFNAQQDANRLMTPQISFAESIHEPGNVLLGTLADMGWVYTYIDHTPLKDTERMDGQPYVVTTRIRSDNGYDPASVKLHYTIDGVNFNTVNMTAAAEPDRFQGSIPGKAAEWAYAYYISVEDIEARVFTSPGKIQGSGAQPEQGTHFFRIGPDVSAPQISHQPVEFLTEGSAELVLNAGATDNVGIKELLVEYSINEGAVQTEVMQRIGNTDSFSASVNLPTLSMDDALKYRIIARDLASDENITIEPADDFFFVDITGIMPVQGFYVNNFNEPGSDFFGSGFGIDTPEGFKNGAIHSDHPYQNGSGPNDQSNFTYQLQIPIRIDKANPVIKFDEIVLVEPGDQGSVFGSENFFDYVIVEGSVDMGVTWEPFGPGYDSRSNDEWLERYKADMSGDNSESQGEPSLYIQRTINMVENGNFFAGDEVLIRFRLFADQLAHGWGWAIDNLSIQAPVTAVEQPLSDVLKVYPIPVSEFLFVEFANTLEVPLNITISDGVGQIVYDCVVEEPGSAIAKGIDVKSFKDGLYILKARAGKQIIVRKFIKRPQ